MLSKSLNMMTILAMLWHSIGGCCMHHAHGDCNHGCMSLGSEDKEHSADCGHEHHIHSKHQPATEQPDRSEPSESPSNEELCCEEGNCVYNRTSSPDLVVQRISPFFGSMEVPNVKALVEFQLLRSVDLNKLAHVAESSRYRCALTQSWQL